MPLTRSFRETVLERAESDSAFRDGLLREAIECLLAGDIETGKIVLRDYINATIGFEELASQHWQAVKEPYAHVWPQGQPAGPQPLRCNPVAYRSTRASTWRFTPSGEGAAL